MWDELTGAMARFPTAVLSWTDADGYPTSVRVAPEPVSDQQVVRFIPPVGMTLRAGPASVMSHAHDEQTWNLRAYLARGRLEQDGGGWLFRPTSFIPGAGMGGPTAPLRMIRDTRATTRRYLEKRGLARPQVRWDRLKDCYPQ